MIKLIRNLSKKELFYTFICLSLIVFQVWLDLKMPDYMAEITKLVQIQGSKISEILVQGGFMLLCAGGSLIASIIVGYFASLIAATFAKVTRSKIFKKISSFSMEEIKGFSSSSLITRTTNDVNQVRMLIAMGLQMLIKAPILAVWAVLKIWNKNFEWTMLVGAIILFLLIIVIFIVIAVLPKFKIVQKLTDNLNRITRENLVGVRVVRAFNAENYQQDKFADASGELMKTQMFTQRAMAIMSPVMMSVMQGMNLGIYFIGAHLINAASMPDKLSLFSDMTAFMGYAMQVVMSFIMLIMIFIIYPRASVSAKRINEVLDTKAKVISGDVTDPKEAGTIEFKKVSFKYPDAEEYMLKDISFKVRQGATVAIIGSTGCGKSTLINLIPRFYDATEGEVLVDGVNVKDYQQESLHNILSYIPQKAVLFSGTVEDNIAYGENGKPKATKNEIKKAAAVAQGLDFIEKMPKQFASHIAQGGTNISGGQKQRIAIARAIARNPEIYIFDDSFSALDYKTDYTLRQELNQHTKDATKVIVAQRIGTIKDADQIIVLEEGEMVGLGTHKELLKNCAVYQEIALSQLSKEELENA